MNELPLAENHACDCGEHDTTLPELDARMIPHAIRHGAILGAFSQLRPGQSMILVAPHDPLPLIAQMQQTFGETFAYAYVERDASAVRVQFTRS